MLKPEKHLHLPHDRPDIEHDVELCVPCYDRIRKAIANDIPIEASNIGSRILGMRTNPSTYNS